MSRERDLECVIAGLTKEAVELREQLATEVFNVVAWKQRAEAAEAKVGELEVVVYQESIEYAELMRGYAAAEAKLKSLDEQEPVAWYMENEAYATPMLELTSDKMGYHNSWTKRPLYLAPIPTVDVHELQRIRRMADCGTAQSFLGLSDEDKRKWFVVSVEESARRKQAEADKDSLIESLEMQYRINEQSCKRIAELERKLEDSTSAKNTALDSLSAANAQIDAFIQKLAEQQAIITQYEIHELPVIINEQLAKAREEGFAAGSANAGFGHALDCNKAFNDGYANGINDGRKQGRKATLLEAADADVGCRCCWSEDAQAAFEYYSYELRRMANEVEP